MDTTAQNEQSENAPVGTGCNLALEVEQIAPTGMDVSGTTIGMGTTHLVDALASSVPKVYAKTYTNGGTSVGLTDANTSEMISRATLIASPTWSSTQSAFTVLVEDSLPSKVFDSSAFTAADFVKIRRYFNSKYVKFTVQMSPPTFAAGAVQLLWYPSVNGFGDQDRMLVPESAIDGNSLIIDIGTQGTGEIIFPLENMLSNLILPVYKQPRDAFTQYPGFGAPRFNLFGTVKLIVFNPLQVAPDAPIKEIPIKLFVSFLEPKALGLYAPMNITVDWVAGLGLSEGAAMSMITALASAATPHLATAAGSLAAGLVTTGMNSLVGKHCTKYSALDGPNVLNAAVTGDGRTISLLGYKQTDLEVKSIEVGDVNPSIKDIVAKRGRVGRCNWSITNTPGQLLETWTVWPSLCRCKLEPAYGMGLIPTPLSHMANCFKLWRGSIDMTIQVVGNSFMKGAIAIVYIPRGATPPTSLEEISARPNIILNISNDRVVKVNVPYNSTLDWTVIPQPKNWTFINYTAPKSQEYAMGKLAVYCWNTLQQATSTAPNMLEINCFISSPDMRFVNPQEPENLYFNVAYLDSVESGVDVYGDATTALVPSHLEIDHMDLRQLLTRRRLIKGNIPVPKGKAIKATLQLPTLTSEFTTTPSGTPLIAQNMSIFDSITRMFAFYTGTMDIAIYSGGNSASSFSTYISANYQGGSNFINDMLPPIVDFQEIDPDSFGLFSSGSSLVANQSVLPVFEACIANYSPYKMLSTYVYSANSQAEYDVSNYIPYAQCDVILDAIASNNDARAWVYMSAGPNFELSMFMGTHFTIIPEVVLNGLDVAETYTLKSNNHVVSSSKIPYVRCPLTNDKILSEQWWVHSRGCDCGRLMKCPMCKTWAKGKEALNRHLKNSHDKVEMFSLPSVTPTLNKINEAADSMSKLCNNVDKKIEDISTKVQDFRNYSPINACKGMSSGLMYATIVAGNNAIKDDSFRPILDHIIVMMMNDIPVTSENAASVFQVYSVVRLLYRDEKDSVVITTITSLISALGAIYNYVIPEEDLFYDCVESGTDFSSWCKGFALLTGSIICLYSNVMPVGKFMEVFPTSTNLSRFLSMDRSITTLTRIITEVTAWFVNSPVYAANSAALEWFSQNQDKVVQWVDDWQSYASAPTNFQLATRASREKGLRLGERALEIQANLNHLEKYNDYIRSVLGACKTAIITYKQLKQGPPGTRVRPVVLTLQGESQVGKSFLATDAIPRFVSREMGWGEDKSVYSIPPKDSFFSGYAQQRIALIDDAFQDPESGIYDYFCQMVSNSDFLPAMPDLPDKGMRFSSSLLLMTMNKDMPNVSKRSSEPDAYYERIFDNYVSVKPKPEFSKLGGKLDVAKLNAIGGQGIAHPDAYLDFEKFTYLRGKFARQSMGKVLFSDLIVTVCKAIRDAEVLVDRMDAKIPLPSLYYDRVESGIELVGITVSQLDEYHFKKQKIEHNGGLIDTDPYFVGVFGKPRVDLFPWAARRSEVVVVPTKLEKVYAALVERIQGPMDKIKTFASEHKSKILAVTTILGTVTAIGVGGRALKNFLTGSEEAYNSDPTYNRAPRLEKGKVRAKVGAKTPQVAKQSGPLTISSLLDDAESVCSLQLYNAIYKNMLKITNGASTNRAIGIKDSYILVNKHFVDLVEDGALLKVKRMGRTSEEVIEYSFPFDLKRCSFVDSEDGRELDFCVIDTGVSSSPFKNIISHFITSEKLAKVIGNGGYRLEYLPLEEKSIDHPVKFSTTVLHDIRTKLDHSVWSSVGAVTHPQVFCANGPLSPGLCGSPWIVQGSRDFPEPGKIVGIHAFGGISGMGSVPVASDYLEAAIASLVAANGPAITPSQVTMDVMESDVPSDYLTIVGRVKPKDAFFSPIKTELKPSPLHGQVFEVTHGPAVLFHKDRRLVEPNFKDKLFRKTDKAVSWFDKIHPDLDQVMIDMYIDAVPKFSVGLLSEDEVINGSIEEPWATRNGLRMDKSPGYPYTKQPRKQPGKYDFFTKLGERFVVSSSLLRDRITKREDMAKMGRIIDDSIWLDCLKDELRPNSKIAAGKTRIINAPPLDYMMLIGKYMGAFRKHFMEPSNMGFKFESALGLDPNAFWNDLAMQIGNNPVFGVDYSQYDSTIHSLFWEKFALVINAWYKRYDSDWQPIHDVIRYVLCYEGAHTIHLFEDMLYMDHHGNPSGFPGGFTTIFNIFVNCYISRVAFSRLGHHPAVFQDYVKALFLGDDNVQIVVGDVGYDRCHLAAVASELNMIVTMPDKSSTITPFDTLEDITFLKRYIRKPKGSPVFLPAIDLQTVGNLLNWYKPGANAQQYAENCRQALMFAAPYGERVHNNIRSSLIELLGNQELPSWRSSLDIYLKNFM